MENRLPRSAKEGFLYGFIICTLTSFVMANMNIAIAMGGLSTVSIIAALKMWPIFLVLGLLVERFIAGKFASKMMDIFATKTDSFNAYILFNTFFTVIGMSITMTILGSLVGSNFNFAVLKKFPINWPRSFSVVLFLELIIVHPIARKVMVIIHSNQDKNK